MAKAVHTLPADLRKALTTSPGAQATWEDITPLARNEWICWVISGKKAETRDIRIRKALSKLQSGMRRPCCWIGCIHRTDKSISPSVQAVLGKRAKV
jgi:hypothetical protein